MKLRFYFLIIVLIASALQTIFAQKITPEQYIEKYKYIALKNKFEYKIPAAITLAQGILESANGNSKLAVEANNHFGIKCHNDWTGKRIYKDDDSEGECFRVYDKAEESFIDHALFLNTRSRYAFLFEYKVTDHEAWAEGLKKAGYATNPKYPQLLMDIVDRYDLDKLDDISKADFEKMEEYTEEQIANKEEESEGTQKKYTKPLYINRIRYVILKEGESVLDIAKIYNLYPKQIYKYNDLPKGATISAGSIVFLQPKRNKGNVKYHSVKKGESLYQISQLHGVKLSKLKQYNHINDSETIKVGDKLNLKKKQKIAPAQE
jgi:LysM repeat protein